ncbi:MAG TPA: hypothetical protein VE965_06340, partial [Gammaproteobacteria bacterium]|nr:hypothetical protein [Gammaproteobacteria bacterium]
YLAYNAEVGDGQPVRFEIEHGHRWMESDKDSAGRYGGIGQMHANTPKTSLIAASAGRIRLTAGDPNNGGPDRVASIFL